MPTTITTSTASTATAYSNQRKIDRCSNGVLWAMYDRAVAADDIPLIHRYSTDNGVTWTAVGVGMTHTSGTRNYTPNGSFFIDQDDYAHVVYKDQGDGYIYYRRGTPNAGRTAWTWSAAQLIGGSTTYDYADVVAHREGTGWVAHIVGSQLASSTDTRVRYARVVISNTGTLTVSDFVAFSNLGGGYSANVHTYPSLDFNHTGDGKTVAGGTPHLYAAWSAGATGAGKGIRFKKATYSAGAWTWGTEREIDNSRYIYDAAFYAICMFDGTRVIIPSAVYNGTQSHILIYERDAADTTTTTRSIITDRHAGSGTEPDGQFSGSATYDANGNVYIVGRDSGSSRRVQWRKWNRSTLSAETPVVFDTIAAAVVGVHVSAQRGYSNGRIEFIYTDGTASPYNVTYDSINLNLAPSVTLAAPGTVDPRVSKAISWTFSDPDAGHTQTAYELDYRVSGGTWASLSTGTTASSYTVPANTFADETNYEIRVRVKDAYDWSAYDTKTFISDSWTYYAEAPPSYREGVLALKPAVYYRLGEAVGTVAYDEVSGNNGELRNSPALGLSGALSVANTAIRFNSANGTPAATQNLRIPKRTPGVGSISMWVDTTSWLTDGQPHGVFQSSDTDLNNFTGWLALFRWQAGTSADAPFYFRIMNDAGVFKDIALPWQTYFGSSPGFHHVVATWGNGSMTLYVDGVNVASRSDLGAYSGDQSANNSQYSLVGYGHGWSGNGTTIDEFAMFDKVLTQTEITNLYSLRTSITDSSSAYDDIIKSDGPVGYWRLGETSGTVAVDSSGNGNNATYRTGVALNSTSLISNDGSPATSVGTSSTGIANVPSKLGLDGRDETVELWVKTPASVTRGGFIYVGSSGYGIGLGSGSFDANGWNLLGLFEVLRWIDTGYVMSPSTTYHVVMTLSASGFPTVFVNGEQVYADTAGAPQVPGGTGFVDIGHTGTRSLQAGTLDEVAVYNRALTAAEIKRHYDAGKGVASLAKTKISTSSLDKTSDYEVQIKVKDGYVYGSWTPAGTLKFTRFHLYEGGTWKPHLKKEYWINEWKDGATSNF